MRSLDRVLLVALVSVLAALQGLPADAARSYAAPTATLHVTVTPNRINVGRDVRLHIVVTSSGNKPVAAHISISGVGKTLQGTAARGTLTIMVHANVLGIATVQATATGFRAATLGVPIVPGPPASVAAIVHGMSILVPHARAHMGAVGSDLLGNYQALTGQAQLASLAARDGTLIDLNSNTDVLIKDPLHATLTGGELFLAVVHGATSHLVQAGTAVAATKGTRFDVRYTTKSRTFVVTVLEGRVQVTNRGKSTLVRAGQQATVVANQPPSAPKNVNVGKVVSWVRALPNTTAAVLPSNLFPPVSAATKAPTAIHRAPAAATQTLTPTVTAHGTQAFTPRVTATGTPTVTPTATAPAFRPPTLRIAFTSLVPGNPSAVIPGQTVTVSGTGFQASELVLISMDGVQLTLPSVLADGTFSTTAVIPVIELAGTHIVTAVGETSGFQHSTELAVAASV